MAGIWLHVVFFLYEPLNTLISEEHNVKSMMSKITQLSPTNLL